MIRIAAVGDVHLGPDTAGTLRPALDELDQHADVLLLAGDLTRHGTMDEARIVAEEFGGLSVPVVAVLGNHDHHSDRADEIRALLVDTGITVLEGDHIVLDIDGRTLGVAGTKGFGGGFAGRSAGAFGEPQMKEFVRHCEETATSLRTALDELAEQGCHTKVALTHYAPVPDTLRGEPPEIYPFLGSYQLAEAIDGAGADLAVHGHAHFGTERGLTPGGVRVRNVAQPVIGAAYAVYVLEPSAADTRSVGAGSR